MKHLHAAPLRTVGMLASLAGSLLLGACGADDAASTSRSTTTSTTPNTAESTTTTGAAPTEGAMRGPGGGSLGTAPTATKANVEYATTSPSQVLDLWLPTEASGPTPLVIYVHGGAFKGGDKAMVGAKVQPLLDGGFAVASVNYRLSGEATFPAGAQDVKAAVRWLRANAATYSIDPDRFAAWGESAGGNLVALLGTTSDQATVLDDPELGNAGVSSGVQAASGEGGCTSPELHDPAGSPESLWVGGAVQDTKELVAQANPITYVATATRLPAFSIAHGDADCNVPFQQSKLLADALTAAGADATLTVLPGAAHADPQFDGTLLQPTVAWLATVVGG